MSARRRVLIVINDLGAGGAQRAALDQAAGLDPERFEIEVASLELAPASPSLSERFRPVAPQRGAMVSSSVVHGLYALDRTIRRFTPELVHSHLAAATVASAIAGRLRGVPRQVTTFHNLTDWQEKRRHPLRLAARRLARSCDAVVVVSEAVRAAIACVDPTLARGARRIASGVDLATFATARATRRQEREARGFGASEFVVGAVARFDRRKGLDLLIEAFGTVHARIPGLRLLLVGDGAERSRLARRVSVLGLEPWVVFAGEQPRVAPWLAAMDLFAAPSRTEGQGLALLEAMATGLPVVAARVGGIPEVLGEGRGGVLVEPESPSALAGAIESLAQDRSALARMAVDAARQAGRFSLAESCTQLSRLYDELLEPWLTNLAA